MIEANAFQLVFVLSSLTLFSVGVAKKSSNLDGQIKKLDYTYTIDIDDKVIVISLKPGITYESSQDQVNTCRKLGSARFCSNLIQRKASSINFCSLPTFKNKQEEIHNLCKVALKKISGVAVQKSRNQVIRYGTKQNMFVTFKDLDKTTTEHSPTVEGLVMVRLPKEKDCTANTIENK